ncbi:protocadherin Fat 3-like [Mercenaria mercenaria]|uniref:protocadherin Fat 3-like n=1 Tax=Mercenaria mercenaria TaxID=6596 RepID=UPI00234E6E7F|nr:protocadherin Fat 3-like [Mercenaria mercenaria]
MDLRADFLHLTLVGVILEIFIEQADGQCDDATRPLQINATYFPQYISSPNYPELYPPYQDCAWIITAPSPYDRITINLEFIDIEGLSIPCKYDYVAVYDGWLSIPCKYDYVAVYDGPDTSATEVAKLCYYNRDTVNSLVSTTDTFYVIFISDFSANYEGFNMLIFTNNTDYKPDCEGITNLTATTQTQLIMSSNLPDLYDSNFTCQILIYPATTYYAVRIDVIFMDIENSDSCANDALRISSVGEDATVEATAECSLAVNYEFTNFPLDVSGTYIEINFTTDSDNNYLGFMLSYTEVFKGINLTSPQNEETIEITVPEDYATGHVNESVCVIVLTYTGTLNLQITPMYESTTGESVSLADVQIFAMTDSPPYVYLGLISSLDYEVIKKFNLLVTMIDSDVTQVTYSVTFNITVTDVDDLAPEFINLPGNYTLSRGQKTGELIYTVNATDGDATEENSRIFFQIESGDTDSMFAINDTTGEVTLNQTAKLIPLATLEYVLTIGAYSGSISSESLVTTDDFTVYVSPDSPPECSHTSVWGETVDVNLAGPGTLVVLLDTWSCTDDNVNLTYSVESGKNKKNCPAQRFCLDSLINSLGGYLTSSYLIY